jgi:NAD(P) transhydrogenase subunit alpha
MHIGVLKHEKDARVAIIPEVVAKFSQAGHSVLVESGAGEGAFCSDALYEQAGATVHSRAEVVSSADILVSMEPPGVAFLQGLAPGKMVISLFNPLAEAEKAAAIAAMPIRAFSLDRVPRTSIAQSMDVLSSQASLAGYKAVLVAANLLPGYFPMLMTAAGTIPPAKVMVLGAGVAGLQAIATARRLGAVVEAFDVRSAVKEEVESLGAKFIEVEGAREEKTAGGYAVEQSEEFIRKQKALVHERASRSNVVITTANIPGRKAPLLIEAATVEAMAAGSVIVDLAAASGGNCALTQNDAIINHKGVTIVGNSNLPAEMPLHASKLFSNNLLNFIKYVFPKGPESLDLTNDIVKGSLIQPAQS